MRKLLKFLKILFFCGLFVSLVVLDPFGQQIARTAGFGSGNAMSQKAPVGRLPDEIRLDSVYVTAYSSSEDETDDTPFETASGMRVQDGIVATNNLPFWFEVRIPALFGMKKLLVADRMSYNYKKHPRNRNGFDVWMRSKMAAIRFGVNTVTVYVIVDTLKWEIDTVAYKALQDKAISGTVVQ